MNTPTTLSLILACQNNRATISACLDSLAEQTLRERLQLIIVDGSRDGTAQLIRYHYPHLTLIEETPPCSLPHLLGRGLPQATGDIIAISEGHCRFPADWAEQVLAAHQRIAEPVIGGAVELGEGLTAVEQALYYVDYGQFMQPLPSGPATEMPGENVSFKRHVLDQADTDFAQEGFWKSFFCWSLQEDGQQLMNEPAITIFYQRQISLGQLLRRRWQHGRCFGGMRAETSSPGRRALIALSGFALPLLLSWRLWRKVWPKGRHRRRFLQTLPLALLAILLWSAGEWWGNLAGPGASCDFV